MHSAMVGLHNKLYYFVFYGCFVLLIWITLQQQDGCYFWRKLMQKNVNIIFYFSKIKICVYFDFKIMNKII